MSDVKTPAGRAAILAVCEAATPRPWVTEETPRLGGSVNALLDGLWRQVAEASGQAAMFDTRATTGEIQQANARFMALARTALPEALEYIERLEQGLRDFEAVIIAKETRLATYGTHLFGCDLRVHAHIASGDTAAAVGTIECTCGLDAALGRDGGQ